MADPSSPSSAAGLPDGAVPDAQNPDAQDSDADADATLIVPVHLGGRSYDIVIGSGLLAGAGAALAALPELAPAGAEVPGRVAILTDRTVAGAYLGRLEAALTQAGLTVTTSLALPSGEESKSFSCLESVLDALLASGVDRSTVLVAFGGGVIGDLAGFAAAILLRGVPFVQIPTTLLAQVDSSVGGKTGINARHGKNLVGAFHQPRLVLADMDVLDSLPARELRAGYAEVVKYGLIDDAAFFAWLERHGAALLAGERALRRQAVAVSCRAKAAIVARDEREEGERALLNLGHTFGHAYEAVAGYSGALLHGEAVALGLVQAFQLSERLGLCPPGRADRVRAHLQATGLPVRLPALPGGKPWSVEALLAAMRKDKKTRVGSLTFVLARDIGAAFVARDVPEDVVRAVLAEVVAEAAPG